MEESQQASLQRSTMESSSIRRVSSSSSAVATRSSAVVEAKSLSANMMNLIESGESQAVIESGTVAHQSAAFSQESSSTSMMASASSSMEKKTFS